MGGTLFLLLSAGAEIDKLFLFSVVTEIWELLLAIGIAFCKLLTLGSIDIELVARLLFAVGTEFSKLESVGTEGLDLLGV